MYPSNTYWRRAIALGGAAAAALAVDACGTNESKGYAGDVPDASTAPDGAGAAPTGETCGQLDKPCCAKESCTGAGTFCSVGDVCKSARPTDVGSRCASGKTSITHQLPTRQASFRRKPQRQDSLPLPARRAVAGRTSA